jgi:hypothetical protein
VQLTKNLAVWGIVSVAVLTVTGIDAVAQGVHDKDRVDLSVVQRIKAEAFDHSKVMDTLSMLTDRYGPRLTGSSEVREAGEWAVSRLKEYGLHNVHLEPWGPFGRSWELQEYSVEMIEPRYSHLRATPLAWTRATDGPVTAEPILATIPRTYSPKKAQENLDKFIATYQGKLQGKVVLLSEPDTVPPAAAPFGPLSIGKR